MILGMDIGGTNCRIGEFIPPCGVVNFEMFPTRKVFSSTPPVKALAEMISDYVLRHGENRTPKGICIGFPATIDKAKTTVLSAPNIPTLSGKEIKESLSALLGFPVWIERDVNLLLLHDLAHHHLSADGTVVGVYVGTGIGNAIFIDGKIYDGKHGVAGELGHIPVKGSEVVCGCGNVGCAEPLSGGRRLKELQATCFPDTHISQLFVSHKSHPLLLDMIDTMALPIAAEINILDPDIVMLGGGVLQMEGFPIDLLLEKIRFHARKPYPAQDLLVYLSPASQESGVIGAGIYVTKQ